jgi:hypothetical protein
MQHDELYNIIPNISLPGNPYPDYEFGLERWARLNVFLMFRADRPILRYNPKGLVTNCSYVTLARILNQDYQWLIDNGLVRDVDVTVNLAIPPHVMNKVAIEAVNKLNEQLVAYDVKEKRSAKLWYLIQRRLVW